MKTEWDYSQLAESYLKRPDYSDAAIDFIITHSNIPMKSKVADIGAGVAHLTLKLANRGLDVTAVEPNDEMRKNGIKRTEKIKNIKWEIGTGETTHLKDNSYSLITYGSSFNVMDRMAALKEAKRISRQKAWLAALWNHRNLKDPIQTEIENIIKKFIPSYNYGTRREDQTSFLKQSGYFSKILKNESNITHTMAVIDIIEAWKSHATLERQAGELLFSKVIESIEKFLLDIGSETIHVPYTTRTWLCQLI